MNIFTIGFTQKSADKFFETLKKSGAERVVDVRLNNVSQLAGFAKKNDLRYFLQEVCGMEYVHLADLAPTKEMLDEYRKTTHDWAAYEQKFIDLMRRRQIEQTTSRDLIDGGCLRRSPHLWAKARVGFRRLLIVAGAVERTGNA